MRWRRDYLHIEHRGQGFEILSSADLPLKGKYQLGAFSKRMNTGNFEDSLSISIVASKKSFQLSIPSEWKIKEKGAFIWKTSQTEAPILGFTWKSFPPDLEVILPNHTSVKFSKRTQSFFQELLRYVPFLAAALALLVHLVFVEFGRWAAAHSEKIARERSQKENIDLSKVETSLVKSPPSSSSDQPTLAGARSFPNAAQRISEAKNLLSSLNVGKPIESADRVLKPSLIEEAFKKLGSSRGSQSLGTWNLSDDELSKMIAEENSWKELKVDPSVVLKTFAPLSSKLKECYDDVLVQDPNLEGKPRLRLVIDLEGRVNKAQIENLPAKSESIRALEACFLSVYRNVQLPKPNREFEVSQTLVLSK